MNKQTISNKQTLKAIKRIFNTKIFKRASELMNTEGEAATLAYVQQFVRSDIKEVLAK